jgi:hypothetical protein
MCPLVAILLDGGVALIAFVMMCVVLGGWFLIRVVSSRWMVSLTALAFFVGVGASSVWG